MAVNIIGSDTAVVTSNRPINTITSFTFSTGLNDVNGLITTNDSEIDHDSLLNYETNEHIDWTDASEDFVTDSSVTAATLTIGAGTSVNTIETTITNSDDVIPTSGAVIDYVTNAVAGTGIAVATSVVYFDDISGVSLVTLPSGSFILDVKVYVTDGSSGEPENDILKIGTTTDDDKYSSTTSIQPNVGWQVPTWEIDPTIPIELTEETTLTAEIITGSTSEPQVTISVWYTTS